VGSRLGPFAAFTLFQTLASASREGRGRTLSGSGYGNTGHIGVKSLVHPR